MAITLVDVGAASTGTGSRSPAIPTGEIGDDLYAAVSCRAAAGAFSTPSGWALVDGFPKTHGGGGANRLYLFHRTADGTEGASVTFTYTAAADESAETTLAQVARFRGVPLLWKIGLVGELASNASAQNIAFGQGVKIPAGAACLYLAHKADDWTTGGASAATLAGTDDGLDWAELGEPRTTTGDDAGMAWGFAVNDGPSTVETGTGGVVVCTGGSSATSIALFVMIGAAPDDGSGWLAPGAWNLTIPEDGDDPNSAADIIPWSTINTPGYELPPYYLNGYGTVVMSCPTDGATTSGSRYPRTEFRELNPDGTNAAWDRQTGGILWIPEMSVDELPVVTAGPEPPRVVIAQFHGIDDEPCRLYFREAAGGGYEIVAYDDHFHPGNGSTYSPTIHKIVPASSGLSLTDHFSVKLTLKDRAVRVEVEYDGQTYAKGWNLSRFWLNDLFYGKAGCYLGVGAEGGPAGTQGTGQAVVTWYGAFPTVTHEGVEEPAVDERDYEYRLINVGSSSIANNGPVTPGLPASTLDGDMVVMLVGARGVGRLSEPAGGGWKLAGEVRGDVVLRCYWRMVAGGIGSLRVDYTDGQSGDVVVARCATFRGGHPLPSVNFQGQVNGSAQDVAGPALFAPERSLVLALGFRAHDATAVDPYDSSDGAAWSEFIENNTGTGDGASLMADWLWTKPFRAIGAGAFAVTDDDQASSVSALVTFTAPAEDVTSVTEDDLFALSMANPASVGIYVRDGESFREAMDQVAQSIGAGYFFDGTGALRVKRLEAPAGEKATLESHDVLVEGMERRPPRQPSIPPWRVNVEYARNWTVQTSGLAGVVTADRKGFLAREHRIATAEDEAIKARHLLAPELTVKTLLLDETDAVMEASRLLTLHGVTRVVYDLPVPLKVVTENGLELMDAVKLKLGRFGMSEGRTFRIIGIHYELKAGRCALSLWG